jgi:hypothetical protein
MKEHLRHELKESPAKEIREHPHLRDEASLKDFKKIDKVEIKDAKAIGKECRY